MNNVTQIVQKYRQAPWRAQRQWIGLFLLGMVLVAMVAAVYVNITTRADLAGRQIQNLKAKMLDNQRISADLEIQLASLTSAEEMEKRAEQLGFHPVSPQDITYVAVPGYTPKQPVDMSSKETRPARPVILPEYTESLFDWLSREFASSAFGGGQP
jgi:cell division protein FtsL